MKNIFLTLAVLVTLHLNSQNFIDTHFPGYEDHDETTVVHVSAKSFDLASALIPANNIDEQEVVDFIGTINALDVIAVDHIDNVVGEYNRGISILDNGYEELVKVKDKGDRFSVYIDENDGTVFEIVGIGATDGEFIVASITGEMSLEIISDILRTMNSGEFKPFSKMKAFEAVDFAVYPNPSNNDGEITIDIPERLIGGDARIFDMNGRVLNTIKVNDVSTKIITSGLEPGNYVIGVEKGDFSMKKKIIIVD